MRSCALSCPQSSDGLSPTDCAKVPISKSQASAAVQQENSAALSSFRVSYRGSDLGEFHLRVPGEHNVENATAAIAVGIGLDVPVERIREALAGFNGVDRRFQRIGTVNGVTVIDDYGHHPTEIRATLSAARQCGFRKIHVIFQPHRYTRTQLLLDDFATAFRDADSVIVVDIYAASEPPIPGVTAELVARRVAEAGGQKAHYVSSFPDAVTLAANTAQSGDMVLTLGAGNVWQIGSRLLEELRTTHDRADSNRVRCRS